MASRAARSTEVDALVGAYSHLDKLPRAADALLTLRKIASLVKPIMRKRGWKVGTLTEFMQPGLLGLNVNRGQKICLRLRYDHSPDSFLPLDEITDTMLHELSHNVFGPHDQKFHDLWNELRGEYDDLKMKGYSGDGFLSDGKRLGGSGFVPIQEMRRQARIQAERRRTLQSGSGQKLGGNPVLRGVDMRAVIAAAAEKRMKSTRLITSSCGSGSKGADHAAEIATNEGHRTAVDPKDTENDRAIVEALWELMQDEEDRKAGVEPELWIRRDAPTSANWQPETGIQRPFQATSSTSSSFMPTIKSEPGTNSPFKSDFIKPESTTNIFRGPPSIPKSTKPTPPDSYKNRDWAVLKPRAKGAPLLSAAERAARAPHIDLTSDGEDDGPSTRPSGTWACNVCTLVNPLSVLACDACDSPRPSFLRGKPVSGPPAARQSAAVASSTGKRPLGIEQPQEPVRRMPAEWRCPACAMYMEQQYWVCSRCGTMKEIS